SDPGSVELHAQRDRQISARRLEVVKGYRVLRIVLHSQLTSLPFTRIGGYPIVDVDVPIAGRIEGHTIKLGGIQSAGGQIDRGRSTPDPEDVEVLFHVIRIDPGVIARDRTHIPDIPYRTVKAEADGRDIPIVVFQIADRRARH